MLIWTPCCCGHSYDVCVSAKFVDTSGIGGAAETGLFISGSAGLGLSAWASSRPSNSQSVTFTARSSDGLWGAEYPGGSATGLTFVDGDVLQITLKRSGADCTTCSGDITNDDFSVDTSASYQTGGTRTWSITGGVLKATVGGSGSFYQRLVDSSDATTYTVKFCINGSQVHSASITWSAGLQIQVGIGASLGLADNVYDDLKIDIDA